MDLKEATLAIAGTKKEIKEERTRHMAAMAELEEKLAALAARCSVLSAGLDADRIARGREVVVVRGMVTPGERAKVVDDACVAVAEGGGRLRREFFGTKNYDRWHNQRCDCVYGYGPRHGSIVFSVGIDRRFRDRWAAGELAPEDVDAALYYLNNLDAVQVAEKDAVG